MFQAVDHGRHAPDRIRDGAARLRIRFAYHLLRHDRPVFEPRVAFQAGGFLTLLMTVILILKAYEARTKDHRHTEMWLYLPEERRPPKPQAQWAISTVMRETYFLFALWTAIISIVMWVIALFFSLIGL